jgi:RES domain
MPLPPSDFSSRVPETVKLPKGSLIHRFYANKFSNPIHFDTSTNGRFNAPDGTYGVLYAAHTMSGAFAETFLRSPGRNIISAKLLSEKGYSILQVKRDLTFLKFSGSGLAVIGATAAISHGSPPYDKPQEWSKQTHLNFPQFDGIAYRSRHNDDELCYAIFDRSKSEIAINRTTKDINKKWFWHEADRYYMGFSPS